MINVFFVGNKSSVLASRRFDLLARSISDCKFFFFDRKTATLYDYNWRVCHKLDVGDRILRNLLLPFFFFRLLCKYKVLIAHVHGASVLLLSLVFFIKKSLYVITTPQGSEVNQLYKGFPAIFTRILLCNSRIVTVKSKFLENCVKKICFVPTVEINWGLDESFLNYIAPPLNGKVKIVSARASQNLYNIDVIFEAIKALKLARDDVEFVYVEFNKDPDMHLDMTIPDFAYKDLDENSIAKLFRQSDVVISIPSHDGFATTVMEAMASGAYQIISDIDSYKNMFDDGSLLKKIACISVDCLTDELNNICETISAIREGRRVRVEHAKENFSQPEQMKKMRAIYQNAIEKMGSLHCRKR